MTLRKPKCCSILVFFCDRVGYLYLFWEAVSAPVTYQFAHLPPGMYSGNTQTQTTQMSADDALAWLTEGFPLATREEQPEQDDNIADVENVTSGHMEPESVLSDSDQDGDESTRCYVGTDDVGLVGTDDEMYLVADLLSCYDMSMYLCFQSNNYMVRPPPFKRQPGRPRTSRIRAADEPKARQRASRNKCSKCQLYGHNSRSCDGPIGGSQGGTTPARGRRGERGGQGSVAVAGRNGGTESSRARSGRARGGRSGRARGGMADGGRGRGGRGEPCSQYGSSSQPTTTTIGGGGSSQMDASSHAQTNGNGGRAFAWLGWD